KLFTWMATCRGAVILLDEAGLESEWVRSEATILAWRAALNPDFRLIPILIDRERSALREAGLNPVDIDELQLVKTVDRPVAEVAVEVAEGLRDLPPRKPRGPMNSWADDVAIKMKVDGFLEDVAADLDIDDEDRNLSGTDLRHAVAYRLLHSDIEEIESAVSCLADSVDKQNRIDFGRLLSPSWIPSAVAGALLTILHGGQTRVAQLEAGYEFTARRLIVRATCANRMVRVIEPPATEGDGELDDVDRTRLYRQELLRAYGTERRPEELENAANTYHKKRHMFVVIEDAAGDGDVLVSLHSEFERVLFVYAGLSEDLEKARSSLDSVGAVGVSPGIDPALEREAWPIANRLEDTG
ncbi:MAG: hypothetical protein ACRBK7_28645, partial [Acidimicrobiales bacterium]